MVVASRCFSRANHASTNLKKFSNSKLDKFTLFTHSFVGGNLENRYKEGVSIFLRLSGHFKREKSVFWKASFCKTRTDYADKTLRLVRISLLISAMQRVLCFFFWGKLFYKSNRKLLTCVCITWYKHSRRWENSRQGSMQTFVFVSGLHKCLEFSNPFRVYIRLCKHGKRFLLLNYIMGRFFCLAVGRV